MKSEVKEAIEAARQHAAQLRSPFAKPAAPSLSLPWFTLGLLAGGAAMYFLDPGQGRRRREAVGQLAKRAGAWGEDAIHRVADRARHLASDAPPPPSMMH